MIKQTKGAVNFLLSAYRALFKAAFYKGLAGGVLLTAGLVSAANADNYTFDKPNMADELEAVFTADADYNAIRDIIPLAEQLSGSYTIGAGEAMRFTNTTIYDVSSADITNNGMIVVDGEAMLLADSIDTLKSLGTIDVQQTNELDPDGSGPLEGDSVEGDIYVYAEHSVLDQSVFGLDKVHSSTGFVTEYDSGAHGSMDIGAVTIAAPSLATYGIELCINGDTVLQTDADKNFTLHGAEGSDGKVYSSEIGFRGDINLVDADGNAVTDGTIVIDDNASSFFENWWSSDTNYVNADIQLTSPNHGLNFEEGIWQARDIRVDAGRLSVGEYWEEGELPQLTMNKLTLVGMNGAVVYRGALNIESAAAVPWQQESGDVDETYIDVMEGAALTVRGDNNAETLDVNVAQLSVTGGSVDLSNAADTVGLQFADGSFSTAADFNKIQAADAHLSANLQDAVGTASLTIDQANTLFGTLADGSGIVSITGASLDLDTENVNGQQVLDASKIAKEDGSISLSFDSAETRSTVLANVSGPVTGGWQGVQLAEGTEELSVGDGTLAIYGSVGGNLVTTASGDAAGLNLGEGAAELNGSGQIGSITGAEGTLTVGNNAQVAVVDADGSGAEISVGTVNAASATITAGKVTADNVSMTDAELNAGEVTVSAGGEFNGSTVTADKMTTGAEFTTFKGTDLQIKGDLQFNGSASVSHGSTVAADQIAAAENVDVYVINNSALQSSELHLANGSTMYVGYESSAEGELTGTGKVAVSAFNLNSGRMVLDPEFGEATATAAIEDFTSEAQPSVPTEDLQINNEINGDIIIGRNSALGAGMTDAELTDALRPYQQNGSLQDNDFGSLLFINKSGLTLNSGYKIVVGSADIAELEVQGAANTIYFGQGGSVIVTAAALSGTDPALTFADTAASGTGNLIAAGGQVVVPAGTSAEQIADIFKTSAGESAVVQVDSAAGSQEAPVTGLTFTTANGLYTGTVADGSSVADLQMMLSDNSCSILSDLSDASYGTTIALLNAASDLRADAPADADLTGLDYVQTGTGTAHGASVETAARLAAFAGAAQSALLTAQSTTDAIAARSGLGAAANLTLAQDHGFGLWLLPIYRTLDSDGFDADGLDAGADVDLYGAALGADYAFANGLTAGLMFNLGSGDADGTDAGSAAENDFDYYSIGAYAKLSLGGSFDLLADLSFSQLDNDFEAQSGLQDYGKLTASADADVWSAGLTAQYKFDLNSAAITPHAGLRWTSVDLDDYSVDSAAGRIASTDADRMDVFSVPVGVKLTTEYETSGWTISPLLDLTLACNFGDDELDTDTVFTGAEDFNYQLSTEVLDSFTYSAALGLAAQYGGLGLAVSADYTGSSNTDGFGVNAQVSYRF